MTLAGADFVFVMGAFGDARDKYFPDAGQSERPHLMAAAIPIVEIADDADALCIRSPNGEARAGDAIDSAELGAEFVVNAAFVALAEEIEVGFAESWQKGIGIAGAMDLAGFIRN